ncbi:DNA glycosylase [Serpentinicella sp. ANB-PHB4]|uniref:DNA-3-methyladenine glycosylase family protein n=1 Tax=Serpentinicella sp. ANB-PHB4 TaxID=3074076 RepID=UPI00285AD9FC|nr:DNA glycosylase [Serpentinicella sp. ANB-PHB4]MDR5658576.1 DNA glycosylase [Serpentinicella sp. ANB-PHB4]
MKYNIIYKPEKITVKGLKQFNPVHIFECGQCFRWNKEDNGIYTGIAHKKVISVIKSEENTIFENVDKNDFDTIWFNYFDLRRDYQEIQDDLRKNDKVMCQAIDFGEGIRILNQELWETIVSFIISANNNIPRIKKSIEMICERYGDYIGTYNGKKRYGFPDPHIIKQLSEADLKACNVGYRASYIIGAASYFDNGRLTQKLNHVSAEESQKKLIALPGVGPKVAHCINVFSLEKREAFPVDVWIKRIMEHLYFNTPTSTKKIQEFADNKFGLWAGYAQQYLFYYGREMNIGK